MRLLRRAHWTLPVQPGEEGFDSTLVCIRAADKHALLAGLSYLACGAVTDGDRVEPKLPETSRYCLQPWPICDAMAGASHGLRRHRDQRATAPAAGDVCHALVAMVVPPACDHGGACTHPGAGGASERKGRQPSAGGL